MRRFLKAAAALTVCLLLLFLIIPLPRPVFQASRSTVLLDRDGELMGALIAEDEQWRFPPETELPSRYKACLLRFEDKRFYYHPGVDPLAVGRSALLNIKARQVLTGASTLSMQVVRLAHPGLPRTLPVKALEAFQAMKLELLYSKEEILLMYASNAPFGGNTVGLSAAAWRYWNRPAADLSWAEAALLAVLPNAPSLMHPGRNRDLLLEKRDGLLRTLAGEGEMDDLTLSLALSEPLPEKPHPVPSLAPHLLQRADREGGNGTMVHSTLDRSLQERTIRIIGQHYRDLSGRGIHNAAAVIAELDSGKVVAYAGNTPDDGTGLHGQAVDIITAPRSPGSLLKPVLYALAMDEGLILPDQMLTDAPVFFGNFTPANFHRTFDGAVPASNALIRSLNIPFVHLLQDYSYNRFHRNLIDLGLPLPYSADHYGLSLILGGAEASLWDLTGMFAGLGRQVQHPEGSSAPVFPLSYREGTRPEGKRMAAPGPAAVWFAFEAMKNLIRPEAESSWDLFQAGMPVAWKTGTSMGGRDAWAVGVTTGYVIGVWVGNADGEGRPGINGLRAAAPLLFDLLRQLPVPENPENRWFHAPLKGMKLQKICSVSGCKAGAFCPDSEDRLIPEKGIATGICPYHRRIHLDETGQYRVDSRSYPVRKMVQADWFVLPPVQEYYYRQVHHQYRSLPPFREEQPDETAGLSFIYPAGNGSVIRIPRLLGGDTGEVIFEAALRDEDRLLYWHMDGAYLGFTRHTHQMGISAAPGPHRVTVIDERGALLTRDFTLTDR